MKLCKCGKLVLDRCTRCNPVRNHALSTKERGYGNDHREASERYRKVHPLCERCVMEIGIMEANPTAEMHHIVPIVDNPTRRMDHMNWLAVCKPCHEQLEYEPLAGMAVKQWSIEHYDNEINGVYKWEA